MRGDTIYCFACREPASSSDCYRIVDRVCHEECFKCQTCRQILSPRMFCTILGDIYCDRHHPNFFPGPEKNHETSNRSQCFVCERPVDEPEPLKGPYGWYHGGCFRCNECRRILSFERYKVIQSKFYCEPKCEPMTNGQATDDVSGKRNIPVKTYFKGVIPVQRTKLTKICHKCSLEVEPRDQVSLLDRNYHRECLRCRHCNRVLSESQCKIIEEFPCCNPDCREEPAVSRSSKSPPDIAANRGVTIKRSPSPKPRAQLFNAGKSARPTENGNVCVADPEKVARLQRKLEEIQTIALEEMNCYVCGKKVYPAERLNMLNRIYHVNCFRCEACNKALGGGRYQIYKGNPYCMPHYKQLSELRSTSNLNVSTLNVGGERAHPVTPFIPVRENPPIQYETPVIPDENGIFQGNHTEEPLCYACAKHVYPAERLNILSRTYHRTCFRCHTCHKQLDIGRFGVIEGLPYCNAHYKQAYNLQAGRTTSGTHHNSKPPKSDRAPSRATNIVNGTEEDKKCYRCGNKVSPSEQLSIMKRIYHKNCFKCGLCQKVLNAGRYGVHDAVPYCTTHYKQVVNMQMGSTTSTSMADAAFNHVKSVNQNSIPEEPKTPTISKTKCFDCNKLTHPINSLILLDRVYHWDCLKCVKCKRSLGRRNYHELSGLIYCQKDYAEEVVNQDSSISTISQAATYPSPLSGRKKSEGISRIHAQFNEQYANTSE